MPYVYQDTLRGSSRNALTIPASNENVLREQFAQTFEENPIKAVMRWNELREDQKTGPLLPAEDARAKLRERGLENDLKVSDAGITQAALDTLISRKIVEKRRQEVFDRADGGFAQGAARLGLAFATTLSDPVSAGLNFVPIVGQARYARWLAGAGSVAGRIGVRAGVGAAEGVAGAALYEPFLYTMRTQEQADYDAADSLLNVAFGGVVGSGLHITVGSLGELYSRLRPAKEAAPRIEPTMGTKPAVEPLPENIRQAIFDQPRAADTVAAMTTEAQQAALRAAVGQAVEGRSINVDPVLLAAPMRPADTPEFRSWFAESRAVTEAGEPLVVYHGTKKAFDQFDPSLGSTPGSWFTTQRGKAEAFGSAIPANLSIKNPASMADLAAARRAVAARTQAEPGTRESNDLVISELEARGFDGIHDSKFTGAGGDGAEVWAAFRPEQIRRLGIARPRAENAVAATDAEYRAATEQAEATLARDVENTTEANLKAAEEEADLAAAEAKELADRLGVNMADDADIAAITEAADRAERWARVAELATVCLVRGG